MMPVAPKRFAVIKAEDTWDFGVGRVGYGWMPNHAPINEDPYHKNTLVAYFDQEHIALEYAKLMSEKHPNVYYTVMESKFAYQCPPGKPVISEFNEKGLIPK